MDNMDDPESNAKISDSGYSNSCSNSQSRRSHSSKSTHSGSNSSGSSGYGGKASTSGSSNILGQPSKKDKETKKRKLPQTEAKIAEVVAAAEPTRPTEPDPNLASPKEDSENVDELAMAIALPEKILNDLDVSLPGISDLNEEDGFSCLISMQDGVVMHVSNTLSSTLGYPESVWKGRSFIDFVHPKDHKIFASFITNRMALPKIENGNQEKASGLSSGSTMVCRMRRYKSIGTFGVKASFNMFMPFLLKFYFKDDDDLKKIYLVIQATPYFSAYKTPNELMSNPVPFVFRHGSNGSLEFIDPDSVPYMGYLPQDIQDRNVLQLYHPDDLGYIRQIYEIIARKGSMARSRPYRILAQNGDYMKVETEWSSVINPWSMKLEFVIAKHHIIQGPTNPDVFQTPEVQKHHRLTEAEKFRIQNFRDSIIKVLNEVRTRPTEGSRRPVGRGSQELASFMETLIEESPNRDDDLRLDDYQYRELNYYERDSEMLGGISPHHDSDSKSSIETPLSFNQLNYNENLMRFFDSQEPHCYESYSGTDQNEEPRSKAMNSLPRNFSPMAQNSIENDVSSISSSNADSPGPMPMDYHYVKLTESMIIKHNVEMENELVKMHRESRLSRVDRERALNESRIKKQEHFARCNATFKPTSVGDLSSESIPEERKHGVKRSSKPQHGDSHAQKHHRPSPRERYRRPYSKAAQNKTSAPVASSQWPHSHDIPSHNTYEVGMPHIYAPSIPLAASNYAPSNYAPRNYAPRNNAPSNYAPSNYAPSNYAPSNYAPSKYAPRNHAPRRVPQMSNSVNMPSTSATAPGPRPMGKMPGTIPGASLPGTSAMPQAMPAAYGCQMSGTSGMPSMPVMPGMAGMYPVYYTPAAAPMPSTAMPSTAMPSTAQYDYPSTSSYQPIHQPSMYPVYYSPAATAMPSTAMPSTAMPSTVMPSTAMPSTARPSTSMPPTSRHVSYPSTCGYQPVQQPSMYPVYYTPAATAMPSTAMPSTAMPPSAMPSTAMPSTARSSTSMPPTSMPPTSRHDSYPSTSGYQHVQQTMPYVVHGHPISLVYGQPYMYPVNSQMYPVPPVDPHILAQKEKEFADSNSRLDLPASNYVQAAELVPSSSTSNSGMSKTRTSDDNTDKTDGESSYSSFYSSFFKTDSGSAEDSGDQMNKPSNVKNRFWTKNVQGDDAMSFLSSNEALSPNARRHGKKLARRKMNAPWNEEIDLSSELVYKYQVPAKPLQEVLEADKLRIQELKQSPLVSEQLEQLYLDLHLQGVAARLTLEEGITSSSSSGEETSPRTSKTKRKRDINKLVIIHEENAPLPHPETGYLAPDDDTNAAFVTF